MSTSTGGERNITQVSTHSEDYTSDCSILQQNSSTTWPQYGFNPLIVILLFLVVCFSSGFGLGFVVRLVFF